MAVQCCNSCSQSWAMPACRQGGCLDIHRAKWAGWHRSHSKVNWFCDACCCNWGVENLLAMEIARSHMDSHLCGECMQMPKPRWFAQLHHVAPGPPPAPPASAPPPPPAPPPQDSAAGRCSTSAPQQTGRARRWCRAQFDTSVAIEESAEAETNTVAPGDYIAPPPNSFLSSSESPTETSDASSWLLPDSDSLFTSGYFNETD